MKKALTFCILLSILCILLTACFVKSCEHTYDNDCDVACNECGEERTITHTPSADDGDCTTGITCTVCGITTTPARDSHTGGTATCVDGKYCEVCGIEYDTVTNPDNHASDTYTYTDNGDGTHTKTHECGVIVGEPENHTIENHVCTACGAMEIVVSFNAGDYKWETGDQIRLHRWTGDFHDIYYFAAEVAEDGTVTWTPDKTLYWNGTDEHTLAVSYPNMNLLYQNFGIPGDQSTLEKLREADCMNAIWSGNPTTDPITFDLKHRLAKVTVNYEVAEGVTISKAEVYTLTQYMFFDIYTLERKNVAWEEGYDLWINSYLDGNQFTAFVSPDAYAADGNFIKITLSDGTVYEVKMNEGVTFVEGGEYIYKVLITADGAYLVCNEGCSFEHIDNGDGTHDKVCTICSNVNNEAHDYVNGKCVCGKYEVTIDLSTLNATYVINDNRYYEFIGSGSYGIKVESGNPGIVLNNASITVGEGSAIDVASGSNATIFVLGDNTIGTTKTGLPDVPCGGIFVAEGGTVNITSNGTDNILRAHGTLAAAIGGKYVYNNNESYNAGSINISNVTVYAYTNKFYASAIGAAGVGTCGTINITNAVVYAYGAGDKWTSAPGIGSAWGLVGWPETIPVVIISGSEIHTFRYNPYSDYIGYLGDEYGEEGGFHATGSINCGEGGSVKSSTIYCYTGLDATTTDKTVKYGALGGLLKEDGTCEGEHSFTGYICDNCGYSCTHEGGENATYDNGICDICGDVIENIIVKYDEDKQSATVTVKEAGTYSLIFAKYGEGNRLDEVDVVEFKFEKGENTVPQEIKDFTLDTNDKIMLWKDMTTLVPLCEAYIVK